MSKGTLILGLLVSSGSALLTGCTKQTRTEPSATVVTPPPQTGETAGGQAGATEKITYTCPMHPEVQQDKPGKCPKCGMLLEAKAPRGAKVIYSCPMHPEVKQDKPGSCPKCKMFLEAKIDHAEGEGQEHQH